MRYLQLLSKITHRSIFYSRSFDWFAPHATPKSLLMTQASLRIIYKPSLYLYAQCHHPLKSAPPLAPPLPQATPFSSPCRHLGTLRPFGPIKPRESGSFYHRTIPDTPSPCHLLVLVLSTRQPCVSSPLLPPLSYHLPLHRTSGVTPSLSPQCAGYTPTLKTTNNKKTNSPPQNPSKCARCIHHCALSASPFPPPPMHPPPCGLSSLAPHPHPHFNSLPPQPTHGFFIASLPIIHRSSSHIIPLPPIFLLKTLSPLLLNFPPPHLLIKLFWYHLSPS